MGRKIDKRKARVRRPNETVAGADRFEIAQRCPVAGQQEMVAVIDRDPKHRVQVGAAAPARLIGRLIDGRVYALPAKPHGGGEAGETGADDVDRACHHKIA